MASAPPYLEPLLRMFPTTTIRAKARCSRDELFTCTHAAWMHPRAFSVLARSRCTWAQVIVTCTILSARPLTLHKEPGPPTLGIPPTWNVPGGKQCQILSSYIQAHMHLVAGKVKVKEAEDRQQEMSHCGEGAAPAGWEWTLGG